MTQLDAANLAAKKHAEEATFQRKENMDARATLESMETVRAEPGEVEAHASSVERFSGSKRYIYVPFDCVCVCFLKYIGRVDECASSVQTIAELQRAKRAADAELQRTKQDLEVEELRRLNAERLVEKMFNEM